MRIINIILAVLLFTGSAAMAAKSSLPETKAGKMSLSFNSEVGGFCLRYNGIYVIRESDLWVHTDTWSSNYYSLGRADQAITVNDTDGRKEILIPHKNEYFVGQHQIYLSDNEMKMVFTYKYLGDRKDVNIQHNLGYLSAPLIAGCPFEEISKSGKTLKGMIPVTAKKMGDNNFLQEDFQKITIDSHIGKLIIEVSGEPNALTMFDARKNMNEWAQRNPIFWSGLDYHIDPGVEYRLNVTVRIEPSQKESIKLPAPHSETLKTTDTNEVRIPSQDPIVVIPQPQQMSLQNGVFTLTPQTKIVVSDNAYTEDFRGAKSFAQEMKDLYGLIIPVVRESQAGDSKNLILVGETTRNAMLAKAASEMNLTAPKNEQGYVLAVTPKQVLVLGTDQPGSYYGMQTLKQLVRVTPEAISLQCCRIDDWPSLKYRGVILYGGKEALPFHKKLIDRIFSRYKMNFLVIADGFFQWESTPEIWTNLSMPLDDVRADIKYADDHYMEVWPLIHSFGKSLWLFANGQNRDIAENPDTPYGYCPNNPKTYEYIFKVYDEALKLFKSKSCFFHIGHDEIASSKEFPKHETCSEKSTTDWLIEDLKKHHDYLTQRGVRVLMWGDELLYKGESPDATNAPSQEAANRFRKELPKDILITDWHYAPDSPESFKSIKLFKEAGFEVMACPWNSPVNIVNLAKAAKEGGAIGFFQTAWLGWNCQEGLIKEAYDQFTAMVMGADYGWNSSKTKLEDLPYRPDEAFRIPWERNLVGRSVSKGFTLDLSPLYNVTLVDNDQKTGWVGIGSISDLSTVPTGEVRFGGDLFKLAENNSKPSAIRLSSRLDGPLAYPESVVIPVNHRADSLIFLQTCCWTEVRGKNIGSYCVVYEDGTREEIQLSYGGNAMAWVDLNKSPNSVEAWTGKTKADERVSLRKMEWRNPNPEKRISRIEFKSAYTEAGPVLLAVSGISAE